MTGKAGQSIISSVLKHCYFLKFRRPPALPYRRQYSTIGRLRLNCRVRDGNECFPQTYRHRKSSSRAPLLFGPVPRPSRRSAAPPPEKNPSGFFSLMDSLLDFFTLKVENQTVRTTPTLFLRKEVIQPHLPIRLPCYDFTPVIRPAFGSSLLKGWVTDFGRC